MALVLSVGSTVLGATYAGYTASATNPAASPYDSFTTADFRQSFTYGGS